jgi:sulfofructose kinase
MIVNYQDRSLDRSTQWMDAIPFAHYGALLADVRWPEGALAALDAARRNGIPTVLDADVSPDDIRPLVERADHVVFSEPGLARMTGHDDLQQGLRAAQAVTAGKVYVTAGAQGCFWLEGDQWQHEPATPVDVVDTTGAGDLFHGAMLVALAEAMPPRAAVRFACRVAALKCTRLGGRAGIPTRAEVDAGAGLPGR